MKRFILVILGALSVIFSKSAQASNDPGWQLVHWGPCLMQEEAYGYRTGGWKHNIPQWGPKAKTACLRRINTAGSSALSSVNVRTLQCRGAASSITGTLVEPPDVGGKIQISFEVTFVTEDGNQNYVRSGSVLRMPGGTYVYRDPVGITHSDGRIIEFKFFQAKNSQAPFSVLLVNGQTIYESCRINF